MTKKFRIAVHGFILQSGDFGATIEEVSERFGFTPQVVGEILNSLQEDGKVWSNETRDSGLFPSPIWRAS